MDEELRDKVEASCRTANEFVKLYYTAFDKERHKITRLFHDTGMCVWNGNPASGKDNIEKLFAEIPASQHSIKTLDVQPVIGDAVPGQPTYIMQVGGTVKYAEKPSKKFDASFVISAADDKWKVISNVYRLQDALTSPNNFFK